MSKKVVICGVDTSTLPKITNKECQQLLERIKQGDDIARQQFITANFRLVLSVVQRYSKKCASADDLFQIGCVGLIKSVDNFDTSLNVKFSTYAVPMIVGEIRRFLRESNSMRVSRGIRDVAYMVLQTREKLERDSNSEVSVVDIAQSLHMPVSKVVYCMDAISDPISLWDKVYGGDDDNVTVMDQLADKRIQENNWVDNVSLNDALSLLSERERNIVIKRYYEGKTQTEISNEVGISQAQVSRLEKNAVSHLKDNMS